MNTAYHRYKPLTPRQLRFIRRLERGDGTAEQVLEELKINGTMFGCWLQKPTFVKRYQRVLQQLQAKAVSVEATASLHKARKKLTEPSPPPAPPEPPLLDDSPLSQRLLELHGFADEIKKKTSSLTMMESTQRNKNQKENENP
jgi:hypothetical protein